MHECTVWLHHQHTAEENLLDRCRQKRQRVYCTLCSSAAAAVAIGQLQLQLSHYSLVVLQAFCFPKCDFRGGLEKNFLGSLSLAIFSGPLINYAIIRSLGLITNPVVAVNLLAMMLMSSADTVNVFCGGCITLLIILLYVLAVNYFKYHFCY